MTDLQAGLGFAGTLVLALALVHKPLGDYMARVLTSRAAPGRRKRAPTGSAGVDPDADQTWSRYLRSVLAFSAVSVLFLYALPARPAHLWPPYAVPRMSAGQAFNTAASFVTNTNWQSYSGEIGAGLRRADGRPGGAELRLRRGRHRGGGRAGARLRPQPRPTGSATSGST